MVKKLAINAGKYEGNVSLSRLTYIIIKLNWVLEKQNVGSG
jgi:hypothetical protein